MLQKPESNYNVGHLNAGIVYVVLHGDVMAAGAQQAHKCVAKDGIAQMADMRRFVGIDAGVLDENFPARGLARFRSPFRLRHSTRELRAVEASIAVSGAGD